MEKYGLVLCGGGGRGAYQIGVWKAMNELGYTSRIAAVSGTSVGALNAALFVSKTVEQAEEIWCSIRTKDLMDFSEIMPAVFSKIMQYRSKSLGASEAWEDMVNYIVREKGIFSRDGLRRLIKSNDICRSVMNSEIPVFACYKSMKYVAVNRKVNFKDMRECCTEDEVIDDLFASSCLPIIFKSGEIDGDMALDGGFLGINTPVEPLYAMGLRKFIIIGLDPQKTFMGSKYYSDAEFIYIKPSDDIYLGKSGIPVIGDGLIDFDGQHAAERINIGYNEGLSQIQHHILFLE